WAKATASYCRARTAGTGVRPLRLSWRHSALAIPTRDHAISAADKYRKQLLNGSLSIEGMSSALAGHYQCVASVDGVGTIVSRTATVFLAEVPEVYVPTRSVSSVAGGVALLPCAVRAPPPLVPRFAAAPAPERRVYGAAKLHYAPPVLKLNVTWLKNDMPVRLESARVAVTASGALEIEPLRHHDAAKYRCRVALYHRLEPYKTSEEVELRVATEPPAAEFPPRFVATPQPQTVVEGASVTFDCAAIGNPKPQITWLNNGVAIDLSDLDSRFYLSGSGSLRVQGARALDAGAYTCRAHSPLDAVDHTVHLHVLTVPRVTVGGGDGGDGSRNGGGGANGAVAVARARGDVTLRCEARARPLPSVSWLKDGDPLTPNHHDIALLDGTSLRIQGVLRVDAGMFQCFASSPAGTATAAVRLLVLPPDDGLVAVSEPAHSNTSSYPPEDEDMDFLGETSSAYTSGPQLEYDDDDIDEDGLDLDALRGVSTNASSVAAPRGLRAVIVKHRFVTLSWQEPEHGAADVTGYAVIYKVKGSERERVSRGGPQRHEMNVASLQPNTTYQFSVLAYSSTAVSSPTESIEVRTPEEELSHGPPQSVKAEALGPHTAKVSWESPQGAAPDRYTVLYSEVETGREQLQVVEGATSVSLTGLRAATAYSVRVSAAGGAPAAPVRLRTPSDAPAAPPANVTATPTGADSILVRWEAPPSRTHRGALTGYKVRYRALSATTSASTPTRRRADSITTPADTRRAELRDLDTATTYQIRVCAINANGSGPFSEWVTAITHQQQRDETRVPPQPPPLTTRAGRDWISVWWSEEGAGSEGVVVRGYVLGWGLGIADEASRDLPAHLHSHVIRNLKSNSEYVISLRASNSLGLGPAVYATVRTKPAAEGDELDDEDDEEQEDEDEPPPLIPPVGLKVIMLSGTTAVVYWTDPTLPKGQTATDGRRYVVRWSANGGRARTFNATDLNCMLDDLRPFTRYEFAVKLIKGTRESAWSMLVSNTTLEAAPASAPRDVRASPAAPPARAADLVWAAPLKPNGIITGYVIMYAAQRAGAAEEWTAVAVVGERTRARVDRLRPRTSYSFKVQARNSKGLGPFSQPIPYTTAMETGEGGGLAGATSAWLWASAGGACAVLALAAALALSLCCRRSRPPLSPLSPDTSTYQKSSASAGIKPPDLWIHHDQMELKHMDKGLHSSASKISAGSTDGALMSSTLTLGRSAPPAPPAPPSAEYEPARHQPPPPASLDRRHYVPTYVDRSSPAEDASRGSPASLCSWRRTDNCDCCAPMTGMGVGVGVGMGGVSCTSTCDRRQHRAPHPDQSTPLLAGVAPLGSPQSSLASLAPLHPHPPHPPPPPCGSGACPLGAACSAPGGVGVSVGGDVYAAAAAARERGTTSRTNRSATTRSGVGGAGGGSLGRRAAACGALHSFALADSGSDRSSPAHHPHSRGSVRETSPYKKSASSSPGHVPNRLQLGGNVSHCAEELEPLTPSRSTERLNREMQNLEGLMKDLSAITQHQFHC
ncbi:LOW QUALITY PROTEIN: neogenin-like, partial [Manduca sexta]|uniref:LOW QUALITY PROTEIN: neogenin-like n=1 Tax=Manduca sexta TaxID=7130 RepID=UPI00188F454D